MSLADALDEKSGLELDSTELGSYKELLAAHAVIAAVHQQRYQENFVRLKESNEKASDKEAMTEEDLEAKCKKLSRLTSSEVIELDRRTNGCLVGSEVQVSLVAEA